jgi:hypothetical protein
VVVVVVVVVTLFELLIFELLAVLSWNCLARKRLNYYLSR